MKQFLLKFLFFIFILPHISFGQDPSTTKKGTVPFGEMEIEVRIVRLYSNTWDTGAKTRHCWYVKAYKDASTVYATYSNLVHDNERPQTVFPNELIYRNYVQSESLGSVKIDFYGFEDEISYGVLPGNSDKRDNRYFAALNQKIDFNSLKLGDNFITYSDSYFSCRLKVTLRMRLPDLIPEVQYLGTSSAPRNYDGDDDTDSKLEFVFNDKICEGRRVKIKIGNNATSPALIDDQYTIKLESHRVGEDDISYTYQVQSTGGGGMQLNAAAPPGGGCDGETTFYCGSQPYDPSCQECITTEVRTPHWDDVVFTDESSNPEVQFEAGDYALMVENRVGDEYLCYSYYQFEIKSPVNPLRLEAPTITDIENPGDSTGIIVATASGGVVAENYQYELYKTGYSNPYKTYQNSGTFPNLPKGTYQVKVKDDLGIEKWYKESASNYSYDRAGASNIMIEEPSATLSYPNAAINGTDYYVTCHDDAFNVTYEIDDPPNIELIYQLRSAADSTANLIESGKHNIALPSAGTYQLYTKTTNGTNWHPVSTNSIVYNKPDTLNVPEVADPNSDTTRISCNGCSDGQLVVSNIGGGEGSLKLFLVENGDLDNKLDSTSKINSGSAIIGGLNILYFLSKI